MKRFYKILIQKLGEDNFIKIYKIIHPVQYKKYVIYFRKIIDSQAQGYTKEYYIYDRLT